MFSLGAVVGSAAAWYLTKTKYEKIAQEEIDSVKEAFSRRGRRAETNPVDEAAFVPTESDKEEYVNIVKHYKKGDSESMDVGTAPYVIPPDEFGEMDYDAVSLVYYEDDVLCYDLSGEVIYNRDEIIGEESLKHFGEYEDDSVFVRNDRLKTDYEILRDNRNYSDVEGVDTDEDDPLDSTDIE
jgi:hypothetical protein